VPRVAHLGDELARVAPRPQRAMPVRMADAVRRQLADGEDDVGRSLRVQAGDT
jgi:hypothetical protein